MRRYLILYRAVVPAVEQMADATPEQCETLLKLTKRYCVVYQTLEKSPRLEVAIT